jgi:hypothetical protein
LGAKNAMVGTDRFSNTSEYPTDSPGQDRDPKIVEPSPGQDRDPKIVEPSPGQDRSPKIVEPSPGQDKDLLACL